MYFIIVNYFQGKVKLLLSLLVYGKEVKTVADQPLDEPLHAGRNTVTYEARHLKALFLKLY